MKRHAYPGTCPRCQALVYITNWDTWDNTTTWTEQRADPIAITPDTETICIILERPTYGHYRAAGVEQLDQREWRTMRWRTNRVYDHILPAHQCGTTLPGTPIPIALPSPASDTAGQLNFIPLDDTPPPF